MKALPFHIVISKNYMQFETSEQLENLIELLFCRATNRRDLYEKLVLDTITTAQGLMEEAGDEGQARSSSLISGVKIIVDKYGRVYDPGKEIMKITSCEEGF